MRSFKFKLLYELVKERNGLGVDNKYIRVQFKKKSLINIIGNYHKNLNRAAGSK